MPIMDGIEATNRIRQTIGATIPIIATTADDESLVDWQKVGVTDFLPKPFNQKALSDVLKRQCNNN